MNLHKSAHLKQPKDPTGGPERPREAQRGPARPREAQRPTEAENQCHHAGAAENDFQNRKRVGYSLPTRPPQDFLHHRCPQPTPRLAFGFLEGCLMLSWRKRLTKLSARKCSNVLDQGRDGSRSGVYVPPVSKASAAVMPKQGTRPRTKRSYAAPRIRLLMEPLSGVG